MKPHQVLLFIAAVMAGLAALCWVLPGRMAWGDKEVRWPTLAEVMKIEPTDNGQWTIDDSLLVEEPIPADSIVLVDSVIPDIPKPVRMKITVDSTTDSRIFLKAFYASLADCGEQVVRVLHYGDSQIEEDRMTQQIRESLQQRFGGSGVGLMPLAQTIPTRTIRQQLHMNGRLVQPAQGPQRYIVYGPKRDQRPDGLYGVMGQVAEMNDSLVSGSESIMALCTPQDKKQRYDRWQVFADNSINYSFSGDTVRLSGRGKVYGLSQVSDTGIIVDNIPMRGCLGLVFNKIDSAQLATFYHEQHVRLIILQFGGNAIPANQTPSTISGIVRGLRNQVRYLQACAPEADILFIGPSDMLTQIDGEWQTYPMIPYMDRLLKKMALEENIAYFSLFRWMGGTGSMKHWQEIGLAGEDGIHFTRAGARKAGNAVANWLISGMDDLTIDD